MLKTCKIRNYLQELESIFRSHFSFWSHSTPKTNLRIENQRNWRPNSQLPLITLYSKPKIQIGVFEVKIVLMKSRSREKVPPINTQLYLTENPGIEFMELRQAVLHVLTHFIHKNIN